MTANVRSVVILGGGTAGWLTAAILAARLNKSYDSDVTQAPINITLVESPDKPPVGVGEGTWPTLRNTLQTIGVSETDFLLECQATFKQGTEFRGWGNQGHQYYHPFTLPESFSQVNLLPYWSGEETERCFSQCVTPQHQVCEQGLAPKQLGTPEFASVCNYGYHLDAQLFADFLKKHCVEKLNVRHLYATISEVTFNADNDIDALLTSDDRAINGELFIDCSGPSSFLLGQHLNEPLHQQHQYLFADKALAIQVGYDDPQQALPVTTLSTAQSNGWIWDIHLLNRRGTGYVYSSKYQSNNDALKTFSDYLGDARLAEKCKQLSFTPGFRKQSWKQNCVAIGLSAGFVEPLEASSIALIERSAHALCDRFPCHQSSIPVLAKHFNHKMNLYWQEIIDFLKLHYVLSQRNDSVFWQDNRLPETVPDTLAERMELWEHQSPWVPDFDRISMFPAASYQYVWAGMSSNMNYQHSEIMTGTKKAAEATFRLVSDKAMKYCEGLPPHRELLNALQAYRFPVPV